ncbi:alpha-galactosidase [Jiangella ureilytica]|uniref:alpha-galactosidase n=1 Tax=Jiangella ureilytica TaxID=2530374 RepID=A0A4R4RR58_9ACTN|nr:alpha-galactosidase [Jiangella ureilytica]TDC52397.1 alpha-galactosidase [Jiangella ureilytica]
MDSSLVVLARAGAGLVLDLDTPGLPRVLHWGADLGPGVDGAAFRSVAVPGRRGGAPPEPATPTLLPAQVDGWVGRPAVSGDRDRAYPHLRLVPSSVSVAPDGGGVEVASRDDAAGVAVVSSLVLDEAGVLRVRHTLTNEGAGAWTVGGLRAVLPVPDHAAELLHFSGRWGLEKIPQRERFLPGIRSLETRRGRTGHSHTGLLVAGTTGFGFGSGEVWGVHAGWSGWTVHDAERLAEGWSTLGAGELLAAGEVVLAPGESYATPDVYFVHSDAGLDGLSARLHTSLRARAAHPTTPRPLVLNTWEAVYFDHDLDRMRGLADRAAAVGVERFVVDDGWFLGRRNDLGGLGDWFVDPGLWPKGLHPLVEHVRSLGMQFGLWVEPEMANPRSRLVEEHPDWLLSDPDRLPRPWRHQHTVDVANPSVYAYLLERLDALVSEYAIDYLKWDHNRDLLEAVHDGHAGVHEQTAAVYRLLDELRSRHPSLEIESCSSGGARVDLGIIQRTDRVWASDSNDPLDRQAIQRWTSLLLPPELIGAHVGPGRTHVSGRVTELQLRCATALFGHAGIEWDITQCSPSELELLTEWAATYKRLRPLLHTGRVVRADTDDAHVLHGVVGDGQAVFSYVALATMTADIPPRLRFPGLEPDVTYRVAPVPGLSSALPRWARAAAWLESGGVELPGRVLSLVGVQAPTLNPAQVLTLELTAIAP